MPDPRPSSTARRRPVGPSLPRRPRRALGATRRAVATSRLSRGLGAVAVAAGVWAATPTAARAQLVLTTDAPTFATPGAVAAGTAGVVTFTAFTAGLTFGPVPVFTNGRAAADPLRQAVTFSTVAGSGSLAFIRNGGAGLGGLVDPCANGVWTSAAAGTPGARAGSGGAYAAV